MFSAEWVKSGWQACRNLEMYEEKSQVLCTICDNILTHGQPTHSFPERLTALGGRHRSSHGVIAADTGLAGAAEQSAGRLTPLVASAFPRPFAGPRRAPARPMGALPPDPPGSPPAARSTASRATRRRRAGTAPSPRPRTRSASDHPP